MDNILMAINFAGGLGIFIFGITIMAEGLQKSAGEKMKSFLKLLTANRVVAILVGAAVTAIIQSSSATTVMVVGFVNAGIINLTQSVGIIMGANIGTTATAWIASMGDWVTFLQPSTIAPLAVAIGVILTFISKSKSAKTVGEVLIGFGLLFIGMDAMSEAVVPLRSSDKIQDLFINIGTNPILGILIGAGVTAIIQSSSASMGILLALVSVGLIPTSAAIYIILGQNIGTCITAILSSVGASKNAKAASYIHLLFNLIGSVIFAILATIFFNLPQNQDIANAIITPKYVALFHTCFNILNTIMLFPFANLLIVIAKKMANINDADDQEIDVTSRLDERAFMTPGFAVQTVFDEICTMYSNTLNNYKLTINSLIKHDAATFGEIAKNEGVINQQATALSNYMAKIMRLDLTNQQSDKVAMYFHIVTDIERIGDHIENLSEFCTQMVRENIHFSEDAVAEMINIFEVTENAITTSFAAFKNDNLDAAIKTIKIEEEVDMLEEQLRTNHMSRLSKGTCDTNTGVVFLDMLQNLERISDHTNNISGYILKNR
ncbi:MAG: Na/Pi cotransporter family protein [Lachnospirales bacterium]